MEIKENTLFLKYKVRYTEHTVEHKINVNWNVNGSGFYFVTGETYLPSVLVINPSGKLTIEQNKNCYELNGNSSLIINRDTKFSVKTNAGYKGDVLFILLGKNPEVRQEYFERISNDDVVFRNLYKDVISNFEECKDNELFWQEKSEEVINRINYNQGIYEQYFDRLDFKKKSTNKEIFKRLNKASDFIETNYNLNLNLEEISKAASLSKYHLIRLFKKAYRITPYNYMVRFRLHKSMQLLQETDLPVNEISLQTGFESLQSFSASFKKQFGIPPSRMRYISYKGLKKAV